MFSQKKSEKMRRDARAKCWPQELAAQSQKRITYTVCSVHTLTYMPWLQARTRAALGVHRKEIFRAWNLLASHILRSVFSRSRHSSQFWPKWPGTLVVPETVDFYKKKHNRGKLFANGAKSRSKPLGCIRG